jgi:hypothetical protein
LLTGSSPEIIIAAAPHPLAGHGNSALHINRARWAQDIAYGDVWADSAYRSSKNEACLKANMLNSRIHRRNPKGRPISEHIRNQR